MSCCPFLIHVVPYVVHVHYLKTKLVISESHGGDIVPCDTAVFVFSEDATTADTDRLGNG